jgi:hypothetical protein
MRSLVLLALLVPHPADACGGHGGGGGGGGGGGHGGGGGSHAKCTEVSSVVGRQHCAVFGQWAALSRLPALQFDTELFHEHFLLAPTSALGTVEHLGTPYTYRVVSDSNQAASAWGLRVRTAWKIAGPIYMGTEIDLGGLASAPQMHVESDGPTIGDPTALFVAARAVVGARTWVTPTLSLAGEFAGGARMVSFNATSQFMGCTQETSVLESAGVLEARARVDWWASPHLTLGASIGTSLIDSNDHSFTVGFGAHARAFDGGSY